LEVRLPIKVTVRDDEPVEKALQRFKRACNKEGLRKMIKRYSAYEKPSDRRRREAKETVRRLRKAELKRERRRPGGGEKATPAAARAAAAPAPAAP
jgi:small subunit ribosomal protein S21